MQKHCSKVCSLVSVLVLSASAPLLSMVLHLLPVGLHISKCFLWDKSKEYRNIFLFFIIGDQAAGFFCISAEETAYLMQMHNYTEG